MNKTWCWATVVSMLDVLCPLGGGVGMRGLGFTLEKALQPLDGASLAEGLLVFMSVSWLELLGLRPVPVVFVVHHGARAGGRDRAESGP